MNFNWNNLTSNLKCKYSKVQLKKHTGPKTKLVFYAPEHYFVNFIAKAKVVGIDLALISSALYSPDLH